MITKLKTSAIVLCIYYTEFYNVAVYHVKPVFVKGDFCRGVYWEFSDVHRRHYTPRDKHGERIPEKFICYNYAIMNPAALPYEITTCDTYERVAIEHLAGGIIRSMISIFSEGCKCWESGF